ncbi:MAG TPA: glycosyltransferase family 2 protein [Piscinibacter sp.]|uniref:glycosyltransferase family 2 protein n=1 Tax=Piscinibacter sp. TaxID=1903157 RepID=UPI002B8670F3|nr:glycosyltransferase family 2 protein [Piscinibacter sp.]
MDRDRSTPTAPRISCVVPAFNEAGNLDALLRALSAELDALRLAWEIVIVDDGSADATLAALRPWLAVPGIRCLQLSRNFGKEAALTAGLEEARGDVVVLMDADLQHPPALIPRMLEAWREGAQMVCMARASRADESALKRLGTRLFYGLVNRSDRVQLPADSGDFRLLDRCVVDALRALPERNRFMKGLYAWVGFRNVVLPYAPPPRHTGRSSFSTRRLAALAVTGITAFTNAPLRWWSALGVLLALPAFAFGLFIVVEHFLTGHDVPGWATLVTGLMFSSGLQLLSIGILGEYIGRIFDEVKQRPLYIVGQREGGGWGGGAATVAPAAQATGTRVLTA